CTPSRTVLLPNAHMISPLENSLLRTPSLNDLVCYESKIRGHHLRLRHALYRQCGIGGSCYQCGGAPHCLSTKSVPHVGGNHAHGRRLYSERFGNAPICLGRRVKF